MTRRPDFRRALVGLPISLVVLGVFWLLSEKPKQPAPKKVQPREPRYERIINVPGPAPQQQPAPAK